MTRIGARLGVVSDDLSGWYKVKRKDFARLGGEALLIKTRKSLPELLMEIYPEHEWSRERFLASPPTPTRDKDRVLFGMLQRKLGIAEGAHAAWYQVRYDDVVAHDGESLLKRYGSLLSLLQAFLPHVPWDAAKFQTKPKLYWDSLEHQRLFLEELGRSLGFADDAHEEWYNVPIEVINSRGGEHLLAKFNRSLYGLLKTAFPEYQWLPWRFRHRGDRWFWSDPQVLQFTADYLASQFHLSTPESWYGLKTAQLRSVGLQALLGSNVALTRFLALVFPEHVWDSGQFSLDSSTSVSQNATA